MLVKDRKEEDNKNIAAKIHELWDMYKCSDEDDLIPETILFGQYEDGRFAVMFMAPKELKSTHEESIMDAILSMKEVMGDRKITSDDFVRTFRLTCNW